MKKSYLFLAISAIMFAACTKEIPVETAQLPTADNAAALPQLTQGEMNYWNYHSVCLDAEGYLCAMYPKGYWDKYNNAIPIDYIFGTYLFNIFSDFRLARSACMGIDEVSYFVTPENKLIKLTVGDISSWDQVSWDKDPFRVYYDDSVYLMNIIDLTPSFPSDVVFLSLTAADNGNVFVTTGKAADGEYGDTFPNHTLYRISAAGRPTEIVTINAPVAATLVTDWGPWAYYEAIPQIEYPNILSKSNGATLYGLDANGNGYKIFSGTGVVEFFTPRVPVKCLTAALGTNNPYALSGNTIVELRPNMAKDIEIGTIPADIAQNAYTLRVNADATAFYVGVKNADNFSYVCKFTR